jgi:glycolate oxidase FAD binding subunit
MTTGTLASSAREAVGSACEVHDPTGADAVDGVPAGVVATPADTAEVVEVLRAAAAHDLSVVPRGHGTKLSWGRAPSSADVVLDLGRLDRVLDHQAGDLIVQTQAGTALADLQTTVAQGGQRLALDEMVPGSTIGGVLAADTSGPQRMLVGTARDLLIGVTVVRADGVVAKAGGRVVKNVAGYDLGKLVIGSFGTLGVVTEAIFRLHPVPEAQVWVSVDVADADDAQRLAQAVVHAQAVPGAVEVDVTATGGGTLSVLLGGRSAAVEARSRTVVGLLGGAATVSETPPDGWASYPWSPGDTGLKLTCVLSGVRDVLAAAAEVGAVVRGSAGTGVLYAALSDPSTVRRAVERLREVCAVHGGSVVVVDAPREVKDDVDVWGPVPALDLMRRVKDQFDPDHRLAAGRFVGGI